MLLKNAAWICADDSIQDICPDFRKTVRIEKEIAQATAQATCIGIYEFSVNGKRQGDALLTPGWTSHKRVQVQTYDITADLHVGDNTLSLLCANGWRKGRITKKHAAPQEVAKEISVIARIEVTYRDGSCECFVTDETWDVYTSHILFSDFYDGETVDMNAEITRIGNARPSEVSVEPVPQEGAPVYEQERIVPRAYFVTPRGERVIDFGQNLAGYVELRTAEKKGTKFVISHAEVLDKDGNFYNENFRTARNILTYVTDGNPQIFKPKFTFEGFRYIRLDEFPENFELSDITAIAIYSDMERTGYFHCENEKINHLYSNIIWGQRGNFIDVPTDCPQRDERLGWTCDAAVFTRTACINYDAERFFRKWLHDLSLDQAEDGAIWCVCPAVFHEMVSSVWGDTATVCPWEVYLAYGDKQILRDAYPMMRRWVQYIHAQGDEEFLWIGGNHYGDWLGMDAGYGRYKGATQTDMIASAYFAYSTDLCIRAGKILGEDVSDLVAMYPKIREAFRAAFMKDGLPVLYPKADGLDLDRGVKGLTQTAIVLILRFDLCNADERPVLVEKLVSMIRENDGLMSTGFVGTAHILHTLSENGRSDLAYDLLLEERNPSWLFSVNHGATTMWEHWDCINDEGEFWSPDMNSFNHYAYGAVYDWIFGVALGIGVPDDGAGYSRITVRPHADKRLGGADGSIRTKHGVIRSAWVYREGGVRYEITVPHGVTAEICIPGLEKMTVTGGSYVFYGEG